MRTITRHGLSFEFQADQYDSDHRLNRRLWLTAGNVDIARVFPGCDDEAEYFSFSDYKSLRAGVTALLGVAVEGSALSVHIDGQEHIDIDLTPVWDTNTAVEIEEGSWTADTLLTVLESALDEHADWYASDELPREVRKWEMNAAWPANGARRGSL